MNFNFFLLIFILILMILNPKLVKSTYYNNIKENETRLLQKQLNSTKQELKNIQQTKNKLLKLYIDLIVYKDYKKQGIIINNQEKDTLKIFEDYETLNIFQKYLLHSLIKSIVKKEEELKEKEKLYLSKLEKLRKKTFDNKEINFGKEKSKFIKSPINGVIKHINFVENTFTVIIEGENCRASVGGIEILKVNLGAYVKVNDILGEKVNLEEKPKIKVNCK